MSNVWWHESCSWGHKSSRQDSNCLMFSFQSIHCSFEVGWWLDTAPVQTINVASWRSVWTRQESSGKPKHSRTRTNMLSQPGVIWRQGITRSYAYCLKLNSTREISSVQKISDKISRLQKLHCMVWNIYELMEHGIKDEGWTLLNGEICWPKRWIICFSFNLAAAVSFGQINVFGLVVVSWFCLSCWVNLV